LARRLFDGSETDPEIRRTLILGLGEFRDTAALNRDTFTPGLLRLYEQDVDAGIRAASEWALRQWGKEAELAVADQNVPIGILEGDRNWYRTGQGHTMVVFRGPIEFCMGSPSTEPDRFDNEQLHRRRIDRNFAIASKEVTVGQFRTFLGEVRDVQHSYERRYAPDDSCPQIAVVWYEAAAYCNWLSKKEGIAEGQWCYEPNQAGQFAPGMRSRKNYLSLSGYRLPTEAEWEYACRAKSVTSRYYGQSHQLLGEYAWFLSVSNERSWPVGSRKPNDYGLFDMLGNALEWCQDGWSKYPPSVKGKASEDREGELPADKDEPRVLRGGSFLDFAPLVRSANRVANQPDYRFNSNGFRVARTYP
jgi:hypothetical protein